MTGRGRLLRWLAAAWLLPPVLGQKGDKGGGTSNGGTGGGGGTASGSTDGHGSIDSGGGSCNSVPSDACSTTGGSASYSETISGETRQIRTGGCPNTNPLTNCLGDNPNAAAEQDWVFDVPATPAFVASTYEASLAGALSLSALGGLVGMTVNGVEVRSCYGGSKYGPCTDWESSAVLFERDTFEYCGGHGNPHHYHNAPVCLLAQMGIEDDGSSPQIGWAADGFPLMGPRGPGGVQMKQCGQSGADATYCVDACGGFYGSWNGRDAFLYRYFMMGDDAVVLENPLSPEPDGSFFPHAPFCLLGCGSVYADGNDRNPSIGSRLPSCGSSASAATTDAYTPEALEGVTDAYVTVAAEFPYGQTYGYDGSDDEGCSDSTTWYYKKTKNTCDAYVAKKTKNCKKKDEFDVKAKHACPVTCEECEVPAPTALPTSCEDSTTWYYKKTKNTCEAYVAKKTKNCKKKDEFDVEAKHACPSVERQELFFVQIAPGIHPKSILTLLVGLPRDVRRVRGSPRADRGLLGLDDVVLQEDQEHLRGLRGEEDQELQEDGRVRRLGARSLSGDVRGVLASRNTVS